MKIKRKYITKLDSIVFDSRLCHGDFHPFNLILSNGNVKIIDWVDASSGDVRADVFRTYLLRTQASVELAEMYFIYCSHTSLSRDEIFQWAPIIVVARLSEEVSPENAVYLNGLLDQYV